MIFYSIKQDRARRLAVIVASCLISWSANAACDLTTTDNTFGGGLDYLDGSEDVRARISLVERHHFTSDVESIRRGSTGPLPKDLEYTLRHIPNHYRALASYARWEQREPRQARTRPRSAECYFQRAIAFRPQDPQLHMLLAVLYHRMKRSEEARAEYQRAEDMGLGSAELFYNRGLLEFDVGRLELSREYAIRAYGLGFPLPGLKDKLNSKGVRL